MEKQEFFGQLERLGLDTQKALERFMGNEALFLSFVERLPEKLDLTHIQQALEQGNDEAFYMGIHNMKGLAGNLSIEPIFDCTQAMLVEFQASGFLHRQKLRALLRETEEASRALAKLVEQYLAEGGDRP